MNKSNHKPEFLYTALCAILSLAIISAINPAHAAKHEPNGYKPAGQEKNFKKDRANKGRPNKDKANRQNNKNPDKTRNQPKKAKPPAVASPHAVPKNNQAARQNPPKKKKHTKDKLKSFLKDTLEFLDEGQNLKHYNHKKTPHHSKSYRNNRDDYDYDYEYRDQFSSCLPHHIIKKRLYRKGWHDFQLLNEGEYRTRLLASNHENYRFRIVIDNCTGRILKAFPVDQY